VRQALDGSDVESALVEREVRGDLAIERETEDENVIQTIAPDLADESFNY